MHLIGTVLCVCVCVCVCVGGRGGGGVGEAGGQVSIDSCMFISL